MSYRAYVTIPVRHPHWPDGTPVLIGQRFVVDDLTRTVVGVESQPDIGLLPMVRDSLGILRPLSQLTRLPAGDDE